MRENRQEPDQKHLNDGADVIPRAKDCVREEKLLFPKSTDPLTLWQQMFMNKDNTRRMFFEKGRRDWTQTFKTTPLYCHPVFVQDVRLFGAACESCLGKYKCLPLDSTN